MLSVAAIAGAFFWRAWLGPIVHSLSARSPYTPAVPLLAPERLAEWHFHLAVARRQELADLVLGMQLAVERESERSLVFLVPADKAAEFRERLETDPGSAKEFGPAADLEGKVGARTTVFFE